MDTLDLISREQTLFDEDLHNNAAQLSNLIKDSKFLVIGGAGSIGNAVSI